jgi:hypothetical protein
MPGGLRARRPQYNRRRGGGRPWAAWVRVEPPRSDHPACAPTGAVGHKALQEEDFDRGAPARSTPYGASTAGLVTPWSRGGLSSLMATWTPHLGAGFALRCGQRFAVPDMASQHLRQAAQLVHQRSVHPGPLVLGTAPRKRPPPTTDRDRTVSRRSEPSSRTALIGEQPNPWDRLQPQDAMSRHRGAKPPRRCGLLGEISLLSPG